MSEAAQAGNGQAQQGHGHARIPVDGERVLLAAPTRRDGEVTRELLRRAGVDTLLCADLAALSTELQNGVGAVLLTDTALAGDAMQDVLAALQRQPPWSDVPVIVLAREGRQGPQALRVLDTLTNVTVLDRPVSTRSMASAVLAALRARRRQYQIRDQIEQQQRAEEALRLADRRKDEFLATLAHELRNPLAPIRTAVQLILRAPGDAVRVTSMAQLMERQVVHLVKLIDDLLELSRISTGKVVLQRARIDMCSVVQAALESTQLLADGARHRVQLDLPADAVWVDGDAYRLAQVLSNLLNNAAKYTPDGGRIGIHLRAQGDSALVTVSDSGAGIPAEMLDDVFNMFTQVNRTLDRAQGGLGIGLSLVRRLMALHGGSVHAESAGLDRGSSFTLRLPLLTAADDAAAAAATDAAAQPARTATLPLRVLVVDDNTDAADALALLLQASGHTTETQYTAAAALHALPGFNPEVIVCDIGMSGMDGYAFAREVRNDRRHDSVLLLAVTGWGSSDDKRRTAEAGFDWHFTKPVDLQALEAVVADHRR